MMTIVYEIFLEIDSLCADVNREKVDTSFVVCIIQDATLLSFIHYSRN